MYEQKPMLFTTIRSVSSAQTSSYSKVCNSPVTTETSALYPWSNHRTGSDNPRWRQQVLIGQNATTGFSAYKREYLARSGSLYVKSAYKDSLYPAPQHCFTRVQGHLHQVPQAAGGSMAPISGTLDEAKRKFIRNAKQHIQPFAGGVFLSELGQTLRMIRSPLKALRRVIGEYAGKLKKVSHTTPKLRRKALVETYLETEFGILQLMRDIDGGRGALSDLLSGPRGVQVTPVKSTAKKQSFGTVADHVENIAGILCHDTLNVLTTTSVRLSGAVRTGSFVTSVPGSFGVYPESFLPDAWELLPYSFIIDYFTNVGAIIDGASMVNANLSWVCATERTIREATVRTTSVDFSTYFPNRMETFVSASFGTVKEKLISRYPVESIVPNLVFRLPDFGSIQSLNIAALIYQSFLGVRRPFY